MAAEQNTQELASLPIDEVQHAVDTLFVYLSDVLYYPKRAKLNPKLLPEPFRELAQGILFIGRCVEETRALANELGRGNLDTSTGISSDNEIASGLKNLQATLKHISWQVGQIAKGDYNQRLSHAGIFSSAINDMIEQLKERDGALRAEIILSRQLASDSHNTVLLLEGITKSIEELIAVVDRSTHELLYTNHAPEQYLRGTASLEELKVLISVRLVEYFSEMAADLSLTTVPFQSQIELKRDDGSISQAFSVTGYPITWMNRKSVVLKLIDITESLREQEELEQVAYYDTLTNAYSRYYGMLTLENWIAESREFTIAFVDMDGLKYVNDTYGHTAGDEYILATAEVLSGFGDQMVISRLGGDEFMLLLNDCPASKAQAELEAMREQLSREACTEYDRSFSFGLAEVDASNTKSSSLLLSIADENMYEDKRSRKKERRAEN